MKTGWEFGVRTGAGPQSVEFGFHFGFRNHIKASVSPIYESAVPFLRGRKHAFLHTESQAPR